MKNIFNFEKLGVYEGDVLVLQGENSLKMNINQFKNIFPNLNEENFKKILMAGK